MAFLILLCKHLFCYILVHQIIPLSIEFMKFATICSLLVLAILIWIELLKFVQIHIGYDWHFPRFTRILSENHFNSLIFFIVHSIWGSLIQLKTTLFYNFCSMLDTILINVILFLNVKKLFETVTQIYNGTQ